MNTIRLFRISLCGLLLTSAASAHANDIVDFLRAVNGVPEERQSRPAPHADPYDSGHGRSGIGARPGSMHGRMSSQFGSAHSVGYGDSRFDGLNRMPVGSNSHRHSELGNGGFAPEAAFDRYDLRQPSSGRSGGFTGGPPRPGSGGSRNPTANGRVLVRVGANRNGYSNYEETFVIPGDDGSQSLPPVQIGPSMPSYRQTPAYPMVPAVPQSPVYGPGQSLPWDVGQFVDCQVPLANCVYVEDECNIAPNAVPVVVAVRDPRSCGTHGHEQLMFVQIFVPQCPPQCVTVSPCRTRVSLNYGRHEVDIKTCEDHIVVDYDN